VSVAVSWRKETLELQFGGEVCEKSEVAEGLGWKRRKPLRPAPTRYI
jgi:hypothetical protein